MALLLVSATSEELLALFPDDYKPSKELLCEYVPFPAPRGLFRHGKPVYCCLTGIGPINAAFAMGQAISLLKNDSISIDHVLITGLAGSHDLERISLRSFCVVTEEIWPEYGLHDGNVVIAQAFRWPLWQNGPNGPVFDRVPLEGLELFDLSKKQAALFTTCRALTVAGVSASFARTNMLWDRYHADLENMEGFSVAYACQRFALPCTEIRCVSNKTGPRKPDEKDFPGALQKLGILLHTLNLT